MEEKSWKQGWMEASYEGGQTVEGAVAPCMDGHTNIKNSFNIPVLFPRRQKLADFRSV
jgi:hypothetical protein